MEPRSLEWLDEHLESELRHHFDAEFYLATNSDLCAETNFDPLLHYLREGWAEGRDPSAEFSGELYLATYPDVAAAGLNPLLHFVTSGMREGRQSFPSLRAAAEDHPEDRSETSDARLAIAPLFDLAFYFAVYPDVAAQAATTPGFDPIEHYLTVGWREGRDPSAEFSTDAYLASNTDVADADINPLLHFVMSGRAEGRAAIPTSWVTTTEDQSNADNDARLLLAAHFDVGFYMAQSGDLIDALRRGVLDPIGHYLETGWRQGLDPSPQFSTSYYLDRNPDVAQSTENPFVHYIRAGRAEGRLGIEPPAPLPEDPILSSRRIVAPEFDVSFYLAENEDLAQLFAAGEFDPITHYLVSGWREGRNPNPNFSTSYYLANNADLAPGENPFVHFLTVGRAEGRDGQPPAALASEEKNDVGELSHARALIERDFDPAYYLANNPDLAAATATDPAFDPLAHYLCSGWREGRDPSPEFSTDDYLSQYPDVARSGENPFVHFVERGRDEGRFGRKSKDESVLRLREAIANDFDSGFYLTTYPDLSDAMNNAIGFDPLIHYLTIGWREGRDPHPEFSTNFYLEHNPDVALSGENPFYHYIARGRSEGRAGREPDLRARGSTPPPTPRDIIAAEFDVNFYVSNNEDIADALQRGGIDPVQHYLESGWRELRDPSPTFSTAGYLAANQDVAASGQNPFFHFITTGRREGRAGRKATPQYDQPIAGRHTDEQEEAMRRIASQRGIIADDFDLEYYLQSNPDLALRAPSEDFDAVSHYLQVGWREGRDPRRDFSTTYYLTTNPDIAASNQNPFVHFVLAGRSEGRLGEPPGGFRAQHLRELRSLRDTMKAWALSQRPQVLKTSGKLVELITPYLKPQARLVVSISHDDYSKHTGGVQLSIRREAEAFESNGDCYLNIHPTQPLPTIADVGDGLRLTLVCNGRRLGGATALEVVEALRQLGVQAQSNLFIVHSLHGHAPEIVGALAKATTFQQAFYWIHDFLAVCAGYNLLRNGVTYCGAPPAGSAACTVCVYGDGRQLHQARISALFESVQFHLVAPSQASLNLWQSNTEVSVLDSTIHPHCRFHDIPITAGAPVIRKVRVGFLGSPTLHKGWPIFQQLVRKHFQDIDFYYLGEMAPTEQNVEWVRVSADRENPSATMADAVAQNEIDHALVWSLCPETFCLTAYEAIAGGANVITHPDAGNVPALVGATGCGVVLANESALSDHFADLANASPRPIVWRGARAELRHSKLTFDVIALLARQAGSQ